ncbi:BZ3500_MvSof-1268-A1-R1_Chr8-2g10258 [Microbotryum saponariae]|uniref:BZ3500_MvSof-1268-A1-R1_Chr8-2g10258 protein n=1 Tax=Microbotryum saponariae TaxID=289078 RepID=A0A2X0N9R1_9BASI|nr:BZ3500_MvSof-1268-A1-R1_Chr8-2g10258 [Microbotryum saponariae]SDA02056.1 BZ3501_MvSof-1269-A2-R1_Chr8-2g10008 [Microbotryum saponariae]
MATANTLLTPFARPSTSPAILLPASSHLPNTTLSYRQLASHIDSLRQQLEAWSGALQVGDVVSMSLINGPEFAIAFLGVGSHRCVAAPLNPTYNPSEVAFYLEDTQSRLVLVPSGAIKANHSAVQAARKLNVPIAEISFDSKKLSLDFEKKNLPGRGKKVEGSGQPREDDVALVLHTSGTTGRPKAVPLTHLNLATTMQNIVNTYKLTARDRTYLVMPLFHVHGLLAGFLAPLLSGGSVVIPPKFSAGTFWAEFIGAKANWYTAVPTIHQILLSTKLPNPIPDIRFIRSCSSALAPATLEKVEKAFNAPVLEAYAMTEAAHQMTSNPLPPMARKPGTVGIGQGVSIRILSLSEDKDVEEGEVAIKGSNVTLGYINNEKANKESFTKDGYFRTGDRGKLDPEGYLTLTGRLKELINRGGEKISPLEVDAALLSLQNVNEAVAFGVPDQKYGEKVWACVVIKAGSYLKEKNIIEQVRKKISSFKCPEKVFVLDSIPKGPTGKINRRNLATKFAQQEKENEGKAKL